MPPSTFIDSPIIRDATTRSTHVTRCDVQSVHQGLRMGLVILLAVIAPASLASEAEEQILGLYEGKGKSLYCATEIRSASRFKVDYLYSEKQLLKQFGCLTARQCQKKDGFMNVANDLHNLYPVERSVVLDRRGSTFDDSPDDGVEATECGYRISYLRFEPPDHAKGNVARALAYMSQRHNLPLVANAELLRQWSEIDPPDDAERERNQAIQRLQGNSNPFIDNPARMDELTGLRMKSW